MLHLYYLHFLLTLFEMFASCSSNVNTTTTINIATHALPVTSHSYTITTEAAATTTISSSPSTTTVSSLKLSSGVLIAVGVCVGLLSLALTIIACIVCYRGVCTKCCDCLHSNTRHCLSHHFWQPAHSHCHDEHFLWAAPPGELAVGQFLPHTPVMWTPPLYEDLMSRGAAVSSPPPSYVSDDVCRTTTTTTTASSTTTTIAAAATNNDNTMQQLALATTTTTSHRTSVHPANVAVAGHTETPVTTDTVTASSTNNDTSSSTSTICDSNTVNTCAVMSQLHSLSPPCTNMSLALTAPRSSPLHSTSHHVVLLNPSRPTQVNIPASFQSLENIDYTIFGSTCQGVNNIRSVRPRPRPGNSGNSGNSSSSRTLVTTGLVLDPALFGTHGQPTNSTSTLNTQL